MDAIRKGLMDLIGNDPTAIFAEVISVNETEAVCDVKLVSNEDMILEKVRLQAIDDESDNGFILVPTVGSIVLVIYAEKIGENRDCIVVMSSKLDKINLKIDNEQKLQITKDLIEFNGGTKGGLVEVAKLKTQINKLESDLTSLKNIFTSWSPIPNDGGASLKAIITTWSAQAIVQTQINDLENNKIKQ